MNDQGKNKKRDITLRPPPEVRHCAELHMQVSGLLESFQTGYRLLNALTYEVGKGICIHDGITELSKTRNLDEKQLAAKDRVDSTRREALEFLSNHVGRFEITAGLMEQLVERLQREVKEVTDAMEADKHRLTNYVTVTTLFGKNFQLVFKFEEDEDGGN